jgi:uncharacterized protein with PIN domain
MIVIDSSALIAILEKEPEVEQFLSIIREAPVSSAPSRYMKLES